MPYERFLALMEGEEAGAPAAEQPAPSGKAEYALRTSLGRGFAGRIEALLGGRCFPGAESLIHILYSQTQTLLDYFHHPIVAMDQPERLRERCDNRLLEFEEHFKTALEREDALPAQAQLLLRYDQVLVKLDGFSVVTLNPFMRAVNDFRLSGLFKFEGLGAPAYQGNPRELARDLHKWAGGGLEGGAAGRRRGPGAAAEQAAVRAGRGRPLPGPGPGGIDAGPAGDPGRCPDPGLFVPGA